MELKKQDVLTFVKRLTEVVYTHVSADSLSFRLRQESGEFHISFHYVELPAFFEILKIEVYESCSGYHCRLFDSRSSFGSYVATVGFLFPKDYTLSLMMLKANTSLSRFLRNVNGYLEQRKEQRELTRSRSISSNATHYGYTYTDY